MPRMKPSSGKASATMRKTTRAKKTTRSKGTFGAAMILLALVCVTGAAMVIAARESAEPSATPTTEPARVASETPVTNPSKPRVAAAPAPIAAANTRVVTSAPSEEAVAPPAGTTPAAVTVAGCLARSGDGYQLKNASGADVPKARSWKSGFLKKGSATIDLVEAARAAKLREHLGERVSVTGVLVNREMQVRSLRTIAPACH